MSKSALPVTVSHVADFGRRYPGETVTFHTRVEVTSAVPHLTLRVYLPAGLVLDTYRVVDGPAQMPQITFDAGANNLIWRLNAASPDESGGDDSPGWRGVRPGQPCEVQVQAHVAPAHTARGMRADTWWAAGEDCILESRAIVSVEARGQEPRLVEETATVAVIVRGRYLQYLPAIYEDDELMGRFLMLFESFWEPIDRQIRDLALYFDPRMTPPGVLPWLASWLDLVLDERWPEEKRRRLVRAAVRLYRKRGTRLGLEEYLEIYTGVRPKIVEHRAHNFRLGPDARLGPGVALGRGNVPHSFTVSLELPRAAWLEVAGAAGPDEAPDHQELERRVRRRVQAVIEAEKPAHTTYVLWVQEVDSHHG